MTLPHLLMVLLVNFAWGFNFIVGKIGAETFGPLFFTGLRFTFLLLLMFPWLKPVPGAMKSLLSVAFLLGAVHFSMVFIGLHAGGNIGSVAITTQLYVPFSAILATLLLREKMGVVASLATVFAFSGVVLIGFDPVVFDHLDAILWTMGAAFVMALATIMMRRSPNLGVFRLQAWIALVAVPSVFTLSFIFEANHGEIVGAASLIDFWTPLYSAVGASIIGHGMLYYLLCRYPVSTVTPLLLPAPVLATFFGVVLLGDNLGTELIVGGIMTILGVLVLLRYGGCGRNARSLADT
ncbi:MAG: EamA/RhaT family transporter [Desulfobulbaceae bacterium]|nr:MAG: EamA/RhaT family transporter [Desulfobulbaceae bacterium]